MFAMVVCCCRRAAAVVAAKLACEIGLASGLAGAWNAKPRPDWSAEAAARRPVAGRAVGASVEEEDVIVAGAAVVLTKPVEMSAVSPATNEEVDGIRSPALFMFISRNVNRKLKF